MLTRFSTLAKASVNAQGFKKIMASRGSRAKQNRTLLDFIFIKKKKMGKMKRMSKTMGNKVSIDKN